MPVGAKVRIGVWEDDRFVGVVLFGHGASKWLGTRFGLKTGEVAELTRIALTDHVTPVSRIISIAVGMLRKLCPGLRLLVSFADPNYGHHGGIYQAAGWVYCGTSMKAPLFVAPDGHVFHERGIGAREGGTVMMFSRRQRPRYSVRQCVKVVMEPKHRYYLPLDDEMRAKVEPLRQEHPKRPKQATTSPEARGGATPTRTLQVLDTVSRLQTLKRRRLAIKTNPSKTAQKK